MTDYNRGIAAPAASIAPITKSDTADVPGGSCRAVLCGTEGTANLIDATGVLRTGVPLQKGYNPIGVRRVLTGGTAANLWALS